MSHYSRVLTKLVQSKIDFVVIGGVALNLYGIPRMTADLDLLVRLDRPNLQRFLKAVKDLGYSPKAPVKLDDFGNPEKRAKWAKEKNMVVFSLVHKERPFELLDILVVDPFEGKKFDKIFISLGRTKVPILGIDQLIELKKLGGRKQDKSDIRELKKIKTK